MRLPPTVDAGSTHVLSEATSFSAVSSGDARKFGEGWSLSRVWMSLCPCLLTVSPSRSVLSRFGLLPCRPRGDGVLAAAEVGDGENAVGAGRVRAERWAFDLGALPFSRVTEEPISAAKRTDTNKDREKKKRMVGRSERSPEQQDTVTRGEETILFSPYIVFASSNYSCNWLISQNQTTKKEGDVKEK